MMKSIWLLLDVSFRRLATLYQMTNIFLVVYRPNLKTKSDADILRDAKLEAMGLPPEDHEHRPHYERPQMATDEMVNDLNIFQREYRGSHRLCPRSWSVSRSGCVNSALILVLSSRFHTVSHVLFMS